MIIKKLNAVFHKHSRILFGIFTLIIIIAFMDFLTPGRGGCDGSNNGGQTVGEVYGKKVSYNDLQEFYRKYAYSVGRMDREMDWPTMFFLYCLNARADQLGIHVSDDEVAAEIAKMPQCQLNGRYDQGKYREYLKRLGCSEEDFVESVRLGLKLKKLSEYVASQVVVTPGEIESAWRDAKTELHFIEASFDNVDAPKRETLKKFFEAHRADYCLAKAAVFPFDPRNPTAAERSAYDFRLEVNKAEPKDREARFDAVAKAKKIKFLPPMWIEKDDFMVGGELAPTLVAHVFRGRQNPDSQKPLTGVITERFTRSCYVGCLVSTAGRDEFAELEPKLKERWRLEQALLMAKREADALMRERNLAARGSKFAALTKLPGVKVRIDKNKPLVFTREKNAAMFARADLTRLRVGDVVAVPTPNGASIYRLIKRVPPRVAMTAADRKKYGDSCREEKEEAAWRAFVEDVMSNCKFYANGQN